MDAKTLVDALEEAFSPRLSMPGRSAANMADFRAAVTDVAGGTANGGDVITFTLAADGKSMTVSAAGKGKETKTGLACVDADIAFALFDTYLGAKLPEVSPTMKAAVKKALLK